MGNHVSRAATLAMIISVFSASEANAQIWIGQIVGNMIAQQQQAQFEASCMTGTALPDSEVAEAVTPARAAMSAYWRAVQSGRSSDVSSLFNLDKKTRWTHAGRTLGALQLNAVVDPFATSGAVFDDKPAALFRSGDGVTARGQWIVRDAAGNRTGTYDASFTRQAGQWRLSTLALFPASQYVDRLVQYCHKRDDVLPYRVAQTEWIRSFTERRAAKARAKADAAATKASAAQTALTSKGPKASAQATEAARLAAERAEKLAQEATARATEAATAAAAATAAKADAAAWEAERVAGRAALAGARPGG